MFFLDHAWLVPLIPAVSFAVILFFGKRMPKGGSEVGVTALGASWLLSCGAFYQWVQRVDRAHRDSGGAAGTVKALRREPEAGGDGNERASRAGGTRSSTRSRGSRTRASSSASASRSTASR